MKETKKVDWGWVRSELVRHERIAKDKKATLAKVGECLEEAKLLVVPGLTSLIKKVISLDTDGIKIEGGIIFATKKIASYIKGATSIYLYAVTIGGGLEKKASFLMTKGEELKGYLLDRIGSFAVESLANEAEEALRRDYASKGKSVSMRFSPGYCDWPIEDERLLDKVLDFSGAGVTLNEKCMMVPVKSISAMLAIGPIGRFKKTASPCMICGVENCDYRRRD